MSIYTETTGQPICPRDPDHPAHRAVIDTLNRAYETAAIDEETGEFTSLDAEEMYSAAAHGREDMSLRVHQAGVRPGVHGLPSNVVIQSAWWTCNVCGFVLPATIYPATI